jgi:prolyl oligopeptidase
MYVAHLRGTELGPDTPVMMYGYGFGGWSVSPWFRAHMFDWFRLGGAFVVPALRGGGEFGETWMQSGMRDRRQNAVDDYIAAAEWLIARGLAGPDRLVAETNSAGGPVVGAAIVQRPDLFAAALFGFPLLDLLRYDAFTGGARWVDQFGSVSDPSVAASLARLSPVHNVGSGVCYPATLVTPGSSTRRRLRSTRTSSSPLSATDRVVMRRSCCA